MLLGLESFSGRLSCRWDNCRDTKAKRDMPQNSFTATVKCIKHLSTIPYGERSAWLPPKPLVPESNSLEPSESICQKLHQILPRECWNIWTVHFSSQETKYREDININLAAVWKEISLHNSLAVEKDRDWREFYCFFIYNTWSRNLDFHQGSHSTNIVEWKIKPAEK